MNMSYYIEAHSSPLYVVCVFMNNLRKIIQLTKLAAKIRYVLPVIFYYMHVYLFIIFQNVNVDDGKKMVYLRLALAAIHRH